MFYIKFASQLFYPIINIVEDISSEGEFFDSNQEDHSCS